MTRPSYAVVNPTIGRPGLARLVATVDGDLSPSSIVVADDWRAARNARRRAFREDADLGLRTVRAGYAVVWGERVTTHPLASPGSWRSSLKDRACNADNALLRAKYGRRWRSLIGTSPGRNGRHLITTAAATAAIAAMSSSRLAGPVEPRRGGGGLCVDRVDGGVHHRPNRSGPRTRARHAIGRATPRRKITMNRAGDGGLRRVLVARLDSLGDVLLAGPTVRAVAARAQVTMLVPTGPDEAARMLPGVDDLIECAAPFESLSALIRGWAPFDSLRAMMRKERYGYEPEQ